MSDLKQCRLEFLHRVYQVISVMPLTHQEVFPIPLPPSLHREIAPMAAPPADHNL